ncbi:MAG TPA: pyridoxal 5'-phosphate synthase glutaminase subunit PdxT, partial [Minicystis sp.]|nr:pyridoxal 5'-phosphate synthase glutaminase subunit PdxT [Minicystis sp.]
MSTVGVLAVQGAFAAHARALAALGHAPRELRAPADFDGLDGLVLPGGESSVQLELIRRLGLAAPIAALAARGVPVLATCAGLILAARRVVTPEQPSFGLLDVAVARNAYGRQLESFTALDDAGARELVFIRAPRIVEVGPAVETLATLRGEPVLVRQGRVHGAAYHPELTRDLSLHAEVFGSARSSTAGVG